MTGKKKYEPKMLYSVTLDDLVPEDDFYRRLESVLDLRFLYKEVRNLYGKTGKPSIDPVVFIKLLLYGYFEGIISDRQLVRRASDSLSARYYLGYDLDEELPWHSTISRTRKLFGEEIFEKVFALVLEQCIAAGLVIGEHQSIDSTLVKANASLGSLQKKATRECTECQLKRECTNAQSRVIYRSYYTEEYERLKQRMKTEEYKIAMKHRKTGPELLFAEAKKDHGLRKFLSRGLSSAQKNSLMIATVQNIKRLLRANKKRKSIANILSFVQKYFSLKNRLELCTY